MADAIEIPTEVPSHMTLDVPVATEESKRSFTVSHVMKGGKDGTPVELDGKRRYLSKNPAGATKKAATRIIRELFGENDDNCVIFIIMQETTKNSKKNGYQYTATRSISNQKREIAFSGGSAKVEGDGDTNGKVGFRYDIKLKSEREIASRANNPTTTST